MYSSRWPTRGHIGWVTGISNPGWHQCRWQGLFRPQWVPRTLILHCSIANFESTQSTDQAHHCSTSLITIHFWLSRILLFHITFVFPAAASRRVPLPRRLHPLEVVLLPADPALRRSLLGESTVRPCQRSAPALQPHHQEVCLWGGIHFCEGRVWTACRWQQDGQRRRGSKDCGEGSHQ